MAELETRRVVEPTDDIKSEKWRALFFLFDGKSILTIPPFPSEDACRESADELMRLLKNFPDSSITFEAVGEPVVQCALVSHFIPIPVGA